MAFKFSAKVLAFLFFISLIALSFGYSYNSPSSGILDNYGYFYLNEYGAGYYSSSYPGTYSFQSDSSYYYGPSSGILNNYGYYSQDSSGNLFTFSNSFPSSYSVYSNSPLKNRNYGFYYSEGKSGIYYRDYRANGYYYSHYPNTEWNGYYSLSYYSAEPYNYFFSPNYGRTYYIYPYYLSSQYGQYFDSSFYGYYNYYNLIPIAFGGTLNPVLSIEAEPLKEEPKKEVQNNFYEFIPEDREFKTIGESKGDFRKKDSIIYLSEQSSIQEQKETEARETISGNSVPEAIEDCSLNFNADSFSIKENENKTFEAEIENFNAGNFFIEFVSANDGKKLVNVSKAKFDSSASLSKNSEILFNVKGIKSGFTELNLRATGQYLSGKRCELSKSIDVKVARNEENTNTVSEISIEAPRFLAVNEKSFIAAISNPTNKQVTFLIEGTGAEVNPKTISVKAESYLEKTIFVEASSNAEKITLTPNLKELNGRIIFFLKEDKSLELISYTDKLNLNESDKLNFTLKNNSSSEKTVSFSLKNFPQEINAPQSRYSIKAGETKTISLNVSASNKVINSSGFISIESAGKAVEKPLIISKNFEEVLISTSASQNIDGTYSLNVKITNTLSSAVNGSIELIVPSSWKVAGNKEVELNANQSKETAFLLSPDKPIEKELFIPVKFIKGSTSQQMLSRIKPSENITALASLTETSVLLGIIFILILMFVKISRSSGKGLYREIRNKTNSEQQKYPEML